MVIQDARFDIRDEFTENDGCGKEDDDDDHFRESMLYYNIYFL